MSFYPMEKKKKGFSLIPLEYGSMQLGALDLGSDLSAHGRAFLI